MVVTTPPSRGREEKTTRKRKREAEEANHSADAVSEKKLEGDSSHESGAMKDGGLQERLGSQEVD